LQEHTELPVRREETSLNYNSNDVDECKSHTYLAFGKITFVTAMILICCIFTVFTSLMQLDIFFNGENGVITPHSLLRERIYIVSS
jgi:hypothetical protein